jgi:hypothetical protein
MTRAPLIMRGGDRFPVDVREILNPDTDADEQPAAARAWREVRVLLTVAEDTVEPRLYLYTRPAAPALDVVWDPDRSILGGKSTPWRIETVDGTFIVTAHRGCGCGNRVAPALFDPFTPMRALIGARR